MIAVVIAIAWGMLSGQFFVQALLSLTLAAVHFVALFRSEVEKGKNGAGIISGLVQSLLFAVLFFAGNWIASEFIDYTSWNSDSIISVIAFLFSCAYVFPQIPGKFLLTRMCAWEPMFFEASNAVPASQRVAFARQHAKERMTR